MIVSSSRDNKRDVRSFDELDALGARGFADREAQQAMFRALAPEPDPEQAHREKPSAEGKAVRDVDNLGWTEGGAKRGREVPKTSRIGAFATSAGEHAIDTLAWPGQKAAQALGYKGDLSGRQALEDMAYLTHGEDPADYRYRVETQRSAYPTESAVGGFAGEALGGAALGGAARLALSPATRAAAARLLADEAGHVRLPVGRGMLSPGSGGRSDEAKAAGAFLDSHPDADAVRGYMGSDYDGVNTTLRTGKEVPRYGVLRDRPPRESYSQQAERIARVLTDAEKAGHAQPGVVMRGLTLPQDVLDRWRAARAIEQRSVWSATANPAVAENFRDTTGDGVRVMLRLHQKDAIPVGGMPGMSPFEDELLLAPGKKWEIAPGGKSHWDEPILDLHQVEQFDPGTNPEVSRSERVASGIEREAAV